MHNWCLFYLFCKKSQFTRNRCLFIQVSSLLGRWLCIASWLS